MFAAVTGAIGHDLRAAEEVMRIGEPLASAILAQGPHAAATDRLLLDAGREILLHRPMEPRSHPEGYLGAFFVPMSDAEMRRRIETVLAALPYISGVKNHGGSRYGGHPRSGRARTLKDTPCAGGAKQCG